MLRDRRSLAAKNVCGYFFYRAMLMLREAARKTGAFPEQKIATGYGHVTGKRLKRMLTPSHTQVGTDSHSPL